MRSRRKGRPLPVPPPPPPQLWDLMLSLASPGLLFQLSSSSETHVCPRKPSGNREVMSVLALGFLSVGCPVTSSPWWGQESRERATRLAFVLS